MGLPRSVVGGRRAMARNYDGWGSDLTGDNVLGNDSIETFIIFEI